MCEQCERGEEKIKTNLILNAVQAERSRIKAELREDFGPFCSLEFPSCSDFFGSSIVRRIPSCEVIQCTCSFSRGLIFIGTI